MFDISSYLDSPFTPYVFALLVAVPFLVLLRQFVYTYIKLKNQEMKMLAVKSNTGNKSQAYERMTLFLERIKPSNLVLKFDKDLAVHEFVFLTEKTVQEEFEYNASQQLYLSKNSWDRVVDSKQAIIELLHKCYEELANPTLDEYKTVLLMKYINGEDFIGKNIEELRKELLIVT